MSADHIHFFLQNNVCKIKNDSAVGIFIGWENKKQGTLGNFGENRTLFFSIKN
jgi:hypothetical protein